MNCVVCGMALIIIIIIITNARTQSIINRFSEEIAHFQPNSHTIDQHIESAMWLICSMLMMMMKNCQCDWWCDQMINYFIFMCYFKNRFIAFSNSNECNEEIMKWLKDWIGLIQMANDCSVESNQTKRKWNVISRDSTLTSHTHTLEKQIFGVCVFISFFSHNFQCNVRRKCALTTSSWDKCT